MLALMLFLLVLELESNTGLFSEGGKWRLMGLILDLKPRPFKP